MIDWLQRLGFQPTPRSSAIECLVPIQRQDIEREVDLIEEISRMHGYVGMGVRDRIEVHVAPIQAVEQARGAVQAALVGMGFVETVTHSLISERAAEAFLPPRMQSLRVADERSRAEPALRPSIIPSMLRVYALNRDRGATEVRLFESAATFAQLDGRHLERVNLAMLEPLSGSPPDLRRIRGAIDRLVQIVFGSAAIISVEPLDGFRWFEAGASIKVNGEVLGTFGVLAPASCAMFGIEESLCAAEIGLPAHYDRYPPSTTVSELPHFPPVERDLSVIVEESVRWNQLAAVVHAAGAKNLEAMENVSTFRGRQIPSGRKSVTMRLRFRRPDRTLTGDEIDQEINVVIAALHNQLGGEIRA